MPNARKLGSCLYLTTKIAPPVRSDRDDLDQPVEGLAVIRIIHLPAGDSLEGLPSQTDQRPLQCPPSGCNFRMHANRGYVRFGEVRPRFGTLSLRLGQQRRSTRAPFIDHRRRCGPGP